VQQQTIANKKRMEEKDPAARVRNFEQLAAIAADPVAHRGYLLRASLLDSVRKRAAVQA
jgi:3-(3-hydroxy-phenyl)propionate hydroxylase